MARPTLISRDAFGAYPGTSAPAYTTTTSWLRGLTCKRGRNSERDVVEAGTGTPAYDNSDRRFDPTFTLSPYYPNVLPMVPQQLAASWLSVEYPLHTGFVERWPIRWDSPFGGNVQPTSVDALAVLAQSTVSGSFPSETTGARIDRVLAAVNWPTHVPPGPTPWVLGTGTLDTTTQLASTAPNSNIDTGQQTVQAVVIPADQPVGALEHIQLMAQTEVGVFFIDGRGYAVFHDRARRYLSTSTVTFSDNPADAGAVWYEDLQPEHDISRVVNDVTVSTTIGASVVAAEAVDHTSRERYFRRSRSLTLPLTTEAALESRASYEVRLYSQPHVRFDQIVLRPESQPSSWPALLGLEISSRVTVRRTPAADVPESIVRECFVESIEHTVTPDSWTMSLQLSPTDAWNGAWIVGTATLGVSTKIVY